MKRSASSFALLQFILPSRADEFGSIKYLDNAITVPPTFGSYYGLERSSGIELDSSMVSCLKLLVSNGDFVVDVFAGYGASYVPLSELVGGTGTIVAIEKETPFFKCLEKNAFNKATWERTLLVHSDPTGADGEVDDNSVSNILNAIQLPCPQFIHFNDHPGLKDNSTFSALLGSTLTITSCRPLMLVDCRASDVVTVSAMVEFLQAVTSALTYKLYWYSGEDIFRSEGTELKRIKQLRIVAVPAQYQYKHGEAWTRSQLGLMDIGSPQVRLDGSEAGTTSIEMSSGPEESVVEYVLRFNNDNNASESTLQPYRIRTQVSVYLSDIVQHNSTLAHRLRTNLSAAGLESIRIPLVFTSQLPMDRSHALASAHCHVWVHKVFAHLGKQLPSDAALALNAERRAILRSCVAFAAGRITTLQRLHTSRQNTAGEIVLPDASTGKGDTYTIIQQQAESHQYYNLTEAAGEKAASKWFERRPFGFKQDDVGCGEPLWCNHAQEMQRRIRAWQFPEERPQEHTTPGPRGAPALHEKSDWSVSRGSTCANSKFLVYEPPSDKHGIGSMLELIAVTFRYAICLDRILILRPYTEEQTLKKWVHPGCEGNFLECYFEPLSGCQLSAADIAAAYKSKDGYQFDRYPLRDEKILVLRGLPLEGDCTLCYSEWKENSRFFDGLFTGAASFNGSSMEHLQHTAAIRSHVKLTWASHFLRYTLKPRAWFSEALDQIISAAMLSPVPVTPGEDTAAVVAGKQQLGLDAFPARFISLHVRFGMKVAEATLQPLTRYMDFISRKLPHLSDIFVSTETDEVISTLISEYPEYRFHYLRYPRKEYLDLGLRLAHVPYHRGTDFVQEFMYSMANLHVAAEASAFVGTLSSNWCMMIMHLERTRGDGGYEYFSMDTGSAFTSCF